MKEQLKEWKRQYREVTGYGKKKKHRQRSQQGKSEQIRAFNRIRHKRPYGN